MRPHRLTHVSRGSRENTPSLMTVSAWRSGARKASSHLTREAIRGALIGNQRSSVARGRRGPTRRPRAWPRARRTPHVHRPLRASPKFRQSSWRESTVERSAPPRLMREAIRGALRRAIRGHQSQSISIDLNRNPLPSIASRSGFDRAAPPAHQWDRSSRGIWWCGRRGSRCRASGAEPWPRPSGT